ncbi:MAG: 50S ribosomal protein L19, partial [Clostridium sp.]|nr:50S ribosomal protein L19 [Clostridium sp.]
MNEILRAIEAEQMRNDLPNFNVGDNVKLHVKVKEGNRERIQMFEGTVIKRQNGGLRETFTVRRVA